jgi:alpha-L-fucosidase
VTRGDGFEAEKAIDKDPDTYWAAPDAAINGSLTVTLRHATRFNRVVLQEYIALGQRIGGFTVEALVGDNWRRIGFGTTIGHKRISAVPETTAHGRARLCSRRSRLPDTFRGRPVCDR